MPSSGRSLGQRSLTCDRRSFRRPPRAACPSPARRRRSKWNPSSEPFEALTKSASEPVLPGFSPSGGSEEESPRSIANQWLYRPMTWSNVLSPDLLHSDSVRSSREEYRNDAKVVITVTMEGTTGPFRTMAKLRSSVEETIQLVLDKYDEEGRTPSLNKNSASSYDLHLSSFTFERMIPLVVWVAEASIYEGEGGQAFMNCLQRLFPPPPKKRRIVNQVLLLSTSHQLFHESLPNS